MYVCLCAGITDRQIKDKVGQGCNRLKDLMRETGLGMHCGKCCVQASEIIRDLIPAADVSALPVNVGE